LTASRKNTQGLMQVNWFSCFLGRYTKGVFSRPLFEFSSGTIWPWLKN
jgi:hypothetical protein